MSAPRNDRGLREKRQAYACLTLSVQCVAVCLSALALGCSSATVVREDATPRVKNVPGERVYYWEPKRGWVMPRHGGWGEAESIGAEAGKAFQAGQYADALFGYLRLQTVTDEGDPSRPENDLRIAECYYQLGDYDSAVEYYARVYRSANVSAENAKESHEKIYEIALAYIHAKADCSFVGFRYECPRYGVDLLVGDEGLITEYPFLDFADDALMEVANFYFDQKEYPEAVPLYRRIVQEYCPARSKWCERAEFQIAMAIFRQIRGVEYDEHMLLESERRFRSYVRGYPRGVHVGEAREHLREISEMLAQRYLRVAKYYLRESQPRAARIYLRIVLERYTSTDSAREARELQRRLDAVSLES